MTPPFHPRVHRTIYIDLVTRYVAIHHVVKDEKTRKVNMYGTAATMTYDVELARSHAHLRFCCVIRILLDFPVASCIHRRSWAFAAIDGKTTKGALRTQCLFATPFDCLFFLWEGKHALYNKAWLISQVLIGCQKLALPDCGILGGRRRRKKGPSYIIDREEVEIKHFFHHWIDDRFSSFCDDDKSRMCCRCQKINNEQRSFVHFVNGGKKDVHPFHNFRLLTGSALLLSVQSPKHFRSSNVSGSVGSSDSKMPVRFLVTTQFQRALGLYTREVENAPL
ncbi:hypothetical protein GHT06_014280 [Daphnia sinensis]|uniref:Uncharacterized protein n=1 Tax=Daphnia sinensis TaxID=1820382 RepID=A0AAD5PUE4_9CRUS|nr:hypothetical protein GHT06_014280 [Daphnia sinensis]